MSRAWVKLHVDMLAHPGTGRLSDSAFRAWVTMLLMAAQNDGVTAGTVEDVAWVLRWPYDKAEAAIAELGKMAAVNDGVVVVRRIGRRVAIPARRRLAIHERHGWRCAVCGSTDRLEVDHILPVSRGGGNTDDNLQSLCYSCNRSKRAKTMAEWIGGDNG